MAASSITPKTLIPLGILGGLLSAIIPLVVFATQVHRDLEELHECMEELRIEMTVRTADRWRLRDQRAWTAAFNREVENWSLSLEATMRATVPDIEVVRFEAPDPIEILGNGN